MVATGVTVVAVDDADVPAGAAAVAAVVVSSLATGLAVVHAHSDNTVKSPSMMATKKKNAKRWNAYVCRDNTYVTAQKKK